MAPLLSIVIGTRDRPAGYASLVSSIDRHTSVPWELLVEDVSDRPGYAEARGDQIRVSRKQPPDGHVKGYNRMFRQARGEWVVWLNDDAEVTAGWAEQSIRWMEQHPLVGLGCLTWSDAGGPWHVAWFCDMPYANFGLLRRGVGDRVGWFDDDLVFYGGDNSLTFKVLLAGYGVMGIPGTHVAHARTQDKHRKPNEAQQPKDHATMCSRYFSQLGKMLLTFRKIADAYKGNP